MNDRYPIQTEAVAVASTRSRGELLHALVHGETKTLASESAPIKGMLIGEIVAIKDHGCVPLVLYPGQAGTAALAAHSMIDLHSTDIGRRVVLMFEGADPERPIVMGVLREASVGPLEECRDQGEREVDSRRLIVRPKGRLVLRCGDASITLTKAGKVLIRGTHVSSHSAGVNRIMGRSVQIN